VSCSGSPALETLSLHRALPISLFLVMDAELELAGPRGMRRRPINGFYTGYKQKDMAADELLTRITLPLPGEDERLRLYKVSRRRSEEHTSELQSRGHLVCRLLR